MTNKNYTKGNPPHHARKPASYGAKLEHERRQPPRAGGVGDDNSSYLKAIISGSPPTIDSDDITR